jgi:hypothetical protein
MSKMRLGSISAAALLLVSVGLAPAADITAKKILIKDNPDPTKRQVLILSKDVGVTFASADSRSPTTHLPGRAPSMSRCSSGPVPASACAAAAPS